MRLIGIALLVLTSAPVLADAPFSPAGATATGEARTFAFSPIAISTADSTTATISESWQRYGLREKRRRAVHIGFWRGMVYGTVGTTIEYHVLGVSAPRMFYPSYWPRSGDWRAMDWRTDPALRRYLRPRTGRGAGVDMDRVELYGVRLD